MLKPSVIQKDVQRYWNKHNVTDHWNFHTVSESINMMNWRDQSYLYYKDLMPTNNASGKVILDYGCGPGWMEMNRLSKRFQAIADQKLDSISRQFLYDLTFNNRGAPIYNGNVAGIGGCYSAKLA